MNRAPRGRGRNDQTNSLPREASRSRRWRHRGRRHDLVGIVAPASITRVEATSRISPRPCRRSSERHERRRGPPARGAQRSSLPTAYRSPTAAAMSSAAPRRAPRSRRAARTACRRDPSRPSGRVCDAARRGRQHIGLAHIAVAFPAGSLARRKSAMSHRPRRQRSIIAAAVPSEISTSNASRRWPSPSHSIAAWIAGRADRHPQQPLRLLERCSARAACHASTMARACGSSFCPPAVKARTARRIAAPSPLSRPAQVAGT